VDTTGEQRALRFSIAMASLTGVAGIVSGMTTGSQAMLFDGMYSFVDVPVTLLSLAVSKLLARERSPRFQYGYFHLEPLVAALGGAILAFACVYAIVNAITDLMTGGHVVLFGIAGLWAALLGICGMEMALYTARKARALNSNLLVLDSRGWIITAALSFALLLSFVLGAVIQRTALRAWTPYVDPLLLLIIALSLLPMPALTVIRAMREILQVAPGDLDRLVRDIMDELVARYAFADYSSHVAKIGRTRFVDIHVLVSTQHGLSVAGADGIRVEVASRLRQRWPEYWLTINFTADRAWM
jgi:predicted Co/Zn/Cd cation transporter (cation efflux family)